MLDDRGRLWGEASAVAGDTDRLLLEVASFDAATVRRTSARLGLRTDATAHACDWHVPAAHYLESWSDTRTASGVYSLIQPMIDAARQGDLSEATKLFAESRSDIECLITEISDLAGE